MASERLRRSESVLLAAIALVAVAVVALLIGGARLLPWSSAAESRVERQDQVRTAGKAAVLAFLDVDYRGMDARMKRVQELSTGTFKEEYAGTTVDLKAAAEQAKSVSVGTVTQVAVNQITAQKAVLLVTASNVVSNTQTASTKATKACPHAGARCDQYRFVVTLTKVGSHWLISDLAGVS